MTNVIFIAEAGVNHNGDLKMALDLVDAAAEAGADMIKFQTFSAENLVTKSAQLADYQRAQLGNEQSQFEMLSRLELDRDAHFVLLEQCTARGIEFLSTPFDLPSLNFLTEKLSRPVLKIGSGDLTNAPLLYAAAKTGRKIMLSTGMASLGQIELALGLLALGFSDPPPPSLSRNAMLHAWADPARRRCLQDKVTLLHCVSNYPASPKATNLAALRTLSQAFQLPVGYSDHTLGGVASISAVALGAIVIEKHLTLDKTLPGPDHSASSEPDELAQIVADVRLAELMMGSPVKACTEEEWSTVGAARKAVVAAQPIAAGHHLTAENITTKRAGGGADPFTYWELLGRPAVRDFEKGDPIDQCT